MRLCSVEGCKGRHEAHGYCPRHYQQYRQFGGIKERTIQTPNRFIAEGSICKIECYTRKGEIKGYILIDIGDLEICKKYKWCINNKGYGVNRSRVGMIHDYILGIKPSSKTMVDHING